MSMKRIRRDRFNEHAMGGKREREREKARDISTHTDTYLIPAACGSKQRRTTDSLLTLANPSIL